MPRRKGIPSYRLHKARNCAVVTIDGQNFYLGRYDSPESYEKYTHLIAEWKSNHFPGGNPLTRRTAAPVSINELILAFWQYAKRRYVKNGHPTSEVRSFRTALSPVRQLYGHEPITNFGPLALVACRQKLIEAGYCRKRINQHVGRIRQAFKWGVARELVPETVWRALRAVEGLRLADAQREVPVEVRFEDFSKTYDLDLLIGGGVIIEMKAVEALAQRHQRQLMYYLFLTGLRHGKVVNLRPEQVEHLFVNNVLSAAARSSLATVDDGWQEIKTRRFRERMTAALRDWGVGLDLGLYEEAAAHLCGQPPDEETEVASRLAPADLERSACAWPRPECRCASRHCRPNGTLNTMRACPGFSITLN